MSLGIVLSCLLAMGILAWALLPIVLEATVPAAHTPASLSELEDLYIQREGTYSTLKELDFDHETGKLIDEDYHELRARYSEEAYRILRKIDEIEAADAASSSGSRKGGKPAPPGGPPSAAVKAGS